MTLKLRSSEQPSRRPTSPDQAASGRGSRTDGLTSGPQHGTHTQPGWVQGSDRSRAAAVTDGTARGACGEHPEDGPASATGGLGAAFTRQGFKVPTSQGCLRRARWDYLKGWQASGTLQALGCSTAAAVVMPTSLALEP